MTGYGLRYREVVHGVKDAQQWDGSYTTAHLTTNLNSYNQNIEVIGKHHSSHFSYLGFWVFRNFFFFFFFLLISFKTESLYVAPDDQELFI